MSFLLFNDFKLSWSKASIWTAYIKFFISTISLAVYFSIFRIFQIEIPFNLLIFEYSTFLIVIAFIIYTYKYLLTNTKFFKKDKIIIISVFRVKMMIINIKS